MSSREQYNVYKKALALFLLPIAGTKEKAKQKENAVWGISPSAEGDQRLCLWKPPPFEKGGRKLSKRRGVVVLATFLPILSPGEVFTFR